MVDFGPFWGGRGAPTRPFIRKPHINPHFWPIFGPFWPILGPILGAFYKKTPYKRVILMAIGLNLTPKLGVVSGRASGHGAAGFWRAPGRSRFSTGPVARRKPFRSCGTPGGCEQPAGLPELRRQCTDLPQNPHMLRLPRCG